MSELLLKNVCKMYDRKQYAVRDFSLKIEDGEFVIFVGPSGCGKSTTLRMIAGLEDITSGELWIDKQLCNYVETKDRDLSMVFQNYALYPQMTVYDNMAFALQIRKVPKKEIDKKVHEAASILGIEHLLKQRPGALSGGQKQRVAIGSAIMREPKAFLMDEPLSNLDAKLRAQMRVELSELHKRLGATMIYVTHDQTEAMTLGTRIVVMKDGYIQQADTPQTLYDHPCNLFVAGFIGSPQMNFMDAELGRDADGYKLTFADQSLHFAGSDALSEYVGKTVVFGIRPENLHTSGEKFTQNAAHTLTMHVDIAELMGAEIYAHCTCDGTSVTVRTPSGEPIHAGDTITAAVDMSRIHLFDKQTERAIAF